MEMGVNFRMITTNLAFSPFGVQQISNILCQHKFVDIYESIYREIQIKVLSPVLHLHTESNGRNFLQVSKGKCSSCSE